MAASLDWCRYCPSGKKENKRTSKKERRIFHKLMRRMNKRKDLLDFSQATPQR